MSTRIAPAVQARPVGEVRTAAAVALALGFALVFLTGFAQPNVLHDVAHDWRHAMSFPCH